MFKSRSIRGLRRDFLGDIPLRYKEGEEARRGSNEKRTVKHGEGGEALGVDGEFRGWIAAGKRTRRHPVRLLLLASPPHTAVISTPRCTPPSTDPPTCLPGLHIIQLTHKTNTMRLLLLPLLGLVLGGESLETLRGASPSHRIFYILPSPSYFNRVRAAQRIIMMESDERNMRPLGLGGRRPTMVNTHPTSLAPSRAPTTAPYLPTHDQTNSPSQHGQRLLPSNPTHSPSPSVPNQGHSFSGFGGGHEQPSLSDNVFFSDSKPAVSDQQDKHTGFVKGFKTPSFSPSHFSISEDHKPPSESSKPSRSDEDLKSSSFDEAKITRLFDTLAPHPDRNPVCNVLPNPGTCRAALPRYYLDPETGTCNCYLYGGCTEDGAGESPGSFFTLEECQRVCRPPNMAEGPVCKDIFKEDDFVSFLVEPLPPKNTKTDHLSNKELLASFYK
ncbi:uncharacterized protein LOC135107547 [Scylla paramamosain]|uniref:uncharacterized protein LOC135107547 n=1 Tax=Scylla paramamosain TaxID=85552 RepID=UPI0030831E7C